MWQQILLVTPSKHFLFDIAMVTFAVLGVKKDCTLVNGASVTLRVLHLAALAESLPW